MPETAPTTEMRVGVTIKDGQIVAEWWTPDIADLLCLMCRECEGWRKTPPLDCEVASRYCG